MADVDDRPEPSTRDLIMKVLSRSHNAAGGGPATTARNLAMWIGRPKADVVDALSELRREGLVVPLPSRRGQERCWLTPEAMDALERSTGRG